MCIRPSVIGGLIFFKETSLSVIKSLDFVWFYKEFS